MSLGSASQRSPSPALPTLPSYASTSASDPQARPLCLPCHTPSGEQRARTGRWRWCARGEATAGRTAERPFIACAPPALRRAADRPCDHKGIRSAAAARCGGGGASSRPVWKRRTRSFPSPPISPRSIVSEGTRTESTRTGSPPPSSCPSAPFVSEGSKGRTKMARCDKRPTTTGCEKSMPSSV